MECLMRRGRLGIAVLYRERGIERKREREKRRDSKRYRKVSKEVERSRGEKQTSCMLCVKVEVSKKINQS